MDRKYRFNNALKILTSAFLIVGLAFIFLSSKAMAEAESESEFLTTDKAFILNARLANSQQFELHFSIAPGYLLYRDHFQFRTLEGQPITLPAESFPLALNKRDEVLGEEYKAYTKPFQLLIPIASTAGVNPGLRVMYQGCAENGFCYAPVAKEIVARPNGEIQITTLSAENFNKQEPDKINSTASSVEAKNITPVKSETDRITTQLKSGALPLTLVFFLGLGLLLSFTPCVLPMIPILANILVGADKPLTNGRAKTLASLYVLSVSICYAIAGVVAGLMGNQLQQTLQKPGFLIMLSIILLLFALNQFGLLRIHLPQFFAQGLHQLQHKQKQGSAFGAIAMGGISALMVSPCVTPALVGALTYIGQTGNALLGGLALFAMAFGMGLPLLTVACLGSHLLPKAGPWMRYIKLTTGLLLVILAGSILMRAFPQSLFATEAMIHQTHFIPVQTETEFSHALNLAQAQKKPVVLDVYADWCIACKQLDKTLFANHTVLDSLKNSLVLRLDLSKQTEENLALQKKLDIVGPPTLLFFDHEGVESKKFRLVGKIESDSFIDHLRQFFTTLKFEGVKSGQ
jgi:thiol:disulfide interchange protein DsbD